MKFSDTPLPPVKKKLSAQDFTQLDAELERLSSREEGGVISGEMAEQLRGLLSLYLWLMKLLTTPKMSITVIRKVFNLANPAKAPPAPSTGKSESTDFAPNVPDEPDHAAEHDVSSSPSPVPAPSSGGAETRPQMKEPESAAGETSPRNRTHPGKRPAHAFSEAATVEHHHPELISGASCLQIACTGRVYPYLREGEPREVIIFEGQSLLAATCHRFHDLRCNICGYVYKAPLTTSIPELPSLLDGRSLHFTTKAQCMVAFMHLWGGLPYFRFAQIQAIFGHMISPATLYFHLAAVAHALSPMIEYLRSLLCEASVCYLDDFTIYIHGEKPVIRLDDQGDPTHRRACYTTVVIAKLADGSVVPTFASGLKHAGEFLEELFEDRPPGLDPPIIVADRSKVNSSSIIPLTLAGCLQHARDYFVKARSYDEVRGEQVLEELSLIFAIDRATHTVSPAERQNMLETYALPLLKGVLTTCKKWQNEKVMPPQSPLGVAVTYFIKHFPALSLACEIPGLALTNNVSEWSFMLAQRLRVNSYFFATTNGARACDTIMSILFMAALAHRNPWEYLYYVYRHCAELGKNGKNLQALLPHHIPIELVPEFTGTCRDYWIPATA